MKARAAAAADPDGMPAPTPAFPVAAGELPGPAALRVPVAMWRKWNDVDGDGLAAAVAFYAMLSLAPLIILIVAIGSAWLGADTTRHYFSLEVAGVIGNDGADLVDRLITARDLPSSLGDWAAWAGLAVLIVGATATFAQVQHALDRIFGAADRPALLELLRVRALSFLLVLGAGVLLGLSLIASSTLNLVVAHGTGSHALRVGAWINEIVSFFVALIAMAALLRVLPDRPPRARQIWIGALFGAALLALGRYLVGWYIGHFSLGSAYGAAGTVVVLMVWIFFSTLAFLAGAVLACVTSPGESATRRTDDTPSAVPRVATDAPGS
jgi:membrane protein